MLGKIQKAHPRRINYFFLVLFSLIWVFVTQLTAEPGQPLVESLSLASGYEALFLIVATLVIGPLNMLRNRRNPVNLNFRRDVGIWAGIMALLHVVFSLQIYFDGNLLSYFFKEENGSLSPQLSLFGLSNDVGLIAALVIIFLMVLSNNYFLRRLKGKRWKNLQRFNYLLFGLTLLHTFGQQISSNRGPIFIYIVVGLAGTVLVAQFIGVIVYQQRSQQRRAAVGASPVVSASKVTESPTLSAPVAALGFLPGGQVGRRRFLTVMGATMTTSFVGGLIIGPALASKATQTNLMLPETQAQAPTNIPTVGATPTVAAVTTTSPSNTSSVSTTTANSVTAEKTATAAATTAVATPSAATTTATATATATATSGMLLATLAALPIGSVKQFTTPDTKKNAFLVREQDGSVKAFSGICTHEPYNLVYDQSLKQFYCSLHGACFETQNGSVTRRPARTSLPALSVTVDKQGNVVYSVA